MAEYRRNSSRQDRDGYRRTGGRPYKSRNSEREPRRIPVPVLDMTLDAPAFAELGLPHPLTCALANSGISEPFPIQAATIPDALAGRDVLGRGQTGSGKTLAFGLPLLTRLMGSASEPRHPRALILVPTRELAMQVRDALFPLAQQVKLSMQLVIGGASYQRQMDGMAKGADIVVATPGRLIDLVDRRACDLSDVSIAVLDEADQMCDMGFFEDVDHLMKLVKAGGQRLLFSATLDGDVRRLVKAHLNEPVEHATDPDTASVSTMTHHLFVVDAREKPEIIHNIAKREGRTICFARTQLGVEQWQREFEDLGVRVDALHGGKSQAARAKAITNFKEGRCDLLIATDVAARGIHVEDIDLVLQIDPPRDPKDYLHRAGRTARAGKDGTVVLIATTRQIRSAESMLKAAGVEAIDKRVHAGDAYIAEVTGAREEVAQRKHRTHLKEEQAVRRAIVSYDDDLSDVDHREARPRTARVDDRRFAPRGGHGRERADVRRVERGAERPHYSSRREERTFDDRPRREERFTRDDRYARDDRPRRDDRFGREARPYSTERRDDRYARDDRPRRDDRFGREARPYNNDRRDDRYARDDRPRRDDRFGREARPYSGERRDDRYARDDRPRREDRFGRDDRPRRDDRPVRDDRPRRDDRPVRDERRPASPTGNRKQVDKPRWNAKDRKSRNSRGK